MDIEESDPQQQQNASELQQLQQQLQQQQFQHQQQQNQQQQQQQMQCDPIYTTTITTGIPPINTMVNQRIRATSETGSMMVDSSVAIPLPAPTPPAPTAQSLLTANPAITTLPLTQTNVKSSTIPTNDYDIDAILLQQFSCMGTTDHEDLISQFQSLMNNQMNRESARFYLEMSNWNLQTALGCFLDFCSLQSMPSMKIVQRQQINAQQQCFQLQNDGTERWPAGCFLSSPLQMQRVNVPSLRPNETCNILADILPAHPPIMWRLCTPNGWYFGDTIWMIPPGIQATQDELQQRMLQLITSEAKPEGYPQINVVISANTQ